MGTSDGTGDCDQLTPEEKKAVRALERLAKTWPDTLHLFGWSGTLTVVRPDADPTDFGKSVVTTVGIFCGGGDPDMGSFANEAEYLRSQGSDEPA